MRKRIKENPGFYLLAAFFVGGLGVVLWDKVSSRDADALVRVAVPPLSEPATRGKAAFDRFCAACHGVNAAGSSKGPPLVHDIYNPGHHADMAFVLAAKQGVPAHHWRFGDMPPQPGASGAELQDIIRYVRELQVANGISYRPHRM